MLRRTVSFFGVVFLLAGIGATANAEKESDFVYGSFGTHYTFRDAGPREDQDVETRLNLDFGNQNFDKVSGSVAAAGIFDLDGRDSGTTFYDIHNTFSTRSIGRLYHAYANINDLGPADYARLGRQTLHRLDAHYFDGLSFETNPYAGFVVTGYGGTPVHLFENQIGFDKGDWLAGGSLQWNPIAKIRLRLDYTHLKDKTSAFRVSQSKTEDDLVGASLWINPSKNFDLFSQFTSYLDEVRDVQLASSFSLPEQGWTFRLRVFRLLEVQDIRVTDWDDFGLAGSYRPYTEVFGSVTKKVTKKISVDVGGAFRKLDANQSASAFNHGYTRGFFSIGLRDLLIKKLDLNGTFDYYHGLDNTLRNDFYGGSFSFAKHFLQKDRLTFGGGTSYYLFRYNLSTGNESNDVQTYFGELKFKLTEAWRLRTKYEFENNDLDNYQTAKASVTWTF